MTSRERIQAVLRRTTPDRVPVTLYEHSPFSEDWATREPSYAPLIELERRYGDSFVAAPLDVPVILQDPNAASGNEQVVGDSVVRTFELDTPRGPLRAVARRDPTQMTWWQIEPLIKTDEDIDRVLSLPDSPPALDAGQLAALQSSIGDAGMLRLSIGDAIGHVVGLFDFEDFVLRCARDDGPIRALLDKIQEQLVRTVRAMGAGVKNACFRLWGPEYCGAPLMNPKVYFPRYVVGPDRALTRVIHETGNFSVIHCHGRLNAILEMIAETGADALEPIETLPMSTADVTMSDVKRRVGNRMCVMGGVQAHTLETGTPEQVRRQVHEVIDAGATDGGFVLLPTSGPFMIPLCPRALANLEAMYRAAHEYGQY